MRIGELARATGTKAETIRYYEREGILPAADRTDSNYRDYSEDHLTTLTFVRRARELGFSMAQVRELLALSDHADKPCQDVDQLVRDQLIEVDRKIEDLTALSNKLKEMVRACEGERIGDCRIVESLGGKNCAISRVSDPRG
ncbi:helix-turn-helix domain-containing protein [uncultured Croceicoccus sp.]|uniref:MerR family transcriptional regulator n=1 Tax=uncultured Croceicoccus sp. TaxID=1295329 RepID=UPI002601EA81|nr:helix-turn-helix domain-containing protein [uncultured Croceicoccus sp.]